MLSERSLRLIDGIRRRPRRSPHGRFADLADLSEQTGSRLRVGVMRVDGIGDWMLTLPLVMALHESPHVEKVTLLSSTAHRALLSPHAGIGFEPLEVWALHHTPWPHGAAGKVLAISAVAQTRAFRAGRELAGRFDVIVLPRWDTDRGQNLRFVAAGSGSAVAGHDPALQPQASPRERQEGDMLSIVCRDEREYAHESERIAALTATLGLSMASSTVAAREFFGLPSDRTGVPGRVMLHTSAHDEFRQWPADRWKQLIVELLKSAASEILLVGGREDRAGHSALAALAPERVRSVAGEVGLAELPRQLDAAGLFIGNDSGPAHVAAAIGVPTVVISCFPRGDDAGHPNSPARFAARSAGGSLVVQPPRALRPFEVLTDSQRLDLIGQIDVQQVLSATESVAGGGRR